MVVTMSQKEGVVRNWSATAVTPARELSAAIGQLSRDCRTSNISQCEKNFPSSEGKKWKKMLYRGTAALEVWARRSVAGKVDVGNLAEDWRDGRWGNHLKKEILRFTI